MFAQRTWAENDVFQMLSLHARRLSPTLTAYVGRVEALKGAAPRLLRPMYAGANMGHLSREADLVVLLKPRSQASTGKILRPSRV